MIWRGLTFVGIFKLSIFAAAYVVWAKVLILVLLMRFVTVIVIASLVRLQPLIRVLRRLAEWARILLQTLERSVAFLTVMLLNGSK